MKNKTETEIESDAISEYQERFKIVNLVKDSIIGVLKGDLTLEINKLDIMIDNEKHEYKQTFRLDIAMITRYLTATIEKNMLEYLRQINEQIDKDTLALKTKALKEAKDLLGDF